MPRIKRALVSATNKEGIVSFVKDLISFDVEIVSTGGTARVLEENGIPVIDVSGYTGFPEMMDGRLKTLHPRIHGGLLGIRDKPEHMEAMKALGIKPIDMLVVNLYRFEETVEAGASIEEAVENIDIGGPAMIRAASKNYPWVTVVTDPKDYDLIIEEMQSLGGEISQATNFNLARKAFSLTARYDAAISNYLQAIDVAEGEFPLTYTMQFKRQQTLRYGENPHQKAAFYRDVVIDQPSIVTATQLWGRELSHNNIMDSDTALEMIMEFDDDACVILKHSNPCGVALSDKSLLDAYKKALAVDSVSAFGGIVGLNRIVDEETARAIGGIFTEVVIAPDFSKEALEILKKKKNIRLLKVPEIMNRKGPERKCFNYRRVAGGILIQERDVDDIDLETAKVVTKRVPSKEEMAALKFAWKIVKYVKSNAIVYAKKDHLIGVGAGQMSRVDSSKIAVMKARDAKISTEGSIVASDAFFPFRDGIDEAAKAGATAVVQPGGSIRDEEVIEAANSHNMAMIFTGMRHFRH